MDGIGENENLSPSRSKIRKTDVACNYSKNIMMEDRYKLLISRVSN